MKRRLLAVDLFAGAGGMSCGLEMAGLHVVAAVERDARAHATFRANHATCRAFAQPVDVHDVTGESVLAAAGVDAVDLVVGGPPCQGFSQAGFRDASDIRNSLVFQFVRLVGELRPQYFVMENVVGMLSFRATPTEMIMDRLARELSGLGYSLNVIAGRPETWKAAVVSAADFGVPQHRRRVLVMGWLSDARPVLEPTHASADRALMMGLAPHVSVRDALEDLPEPIAAAPQPHGERTPTSEFGRLMREGATALFDHVPTRHRAFMVERMQAQAQGTPLYDTWAHAWHRLDADRPSPTVKENHNAPFVHPWQPRVTTPRECARLQSFPDRFTFTGPKSRKLVQVGNAVPPLLGRAIGRAVIIAAAALEEERAEAQAAATVRA
jgi:DNA (cytosine-5)-methyltransferase 1